MKVRKYLTAVWIGFWLLMAFLPVEAFAAGSIDLNRETSLCISCQENETSLVGVPYSLYLVATVDEYGELTPVAPFELFNVMIRGENDEAWRTLATTLEAYVIRDQIAPADTSVTDETGKAVFPTGENTLTPGLYLVLGSRHTQDGYIYESTPFMAMLPGLDQEANEWIYDVTVNGKFSSQEVPPTPEPVSRKVLKVWDDDDHAEYRPKEVTVQLFCDGELYDTVILNGKNNWRYTWEELESDHKWTLTENEIEDYVPIITEEGITFVVTNYYAPLPDAPAPDKLTPTPTPRPGTTGRPGGSGSPGSSGSSGGSGSSYSGSGTKLPQTGQLWWPVPVLLAGGLLMLVIGLLRQRGKRDEK
ncbi:MAG: Cna B-type domain-containing protein [Blautia sp.]|nr:Cna B-type domain-containing protein [Blautia sp.]MDY5031283.1 Cna B-type domain-containing protein [Blautia sp.]